MLCPTCQATNADDAEECFTCGKALHAVTYGHVLNGRYEVRRLLGRGGMGRVYEALDRVLEEAVAIKLLRAELTSEPGMARRLRSEIKLARKVSHRNVCRIHEYGEDMGAAYISMELIEGQKLTDWLRGERRTPAELFELAYQIADGLAAIHEHGIVHRDFKPANIMVNARGVAKIMDFGIAKQVGDARTRTASDVVLGTPEYMSPEQIRGERLDCRSDIYALGCVVFEMFTRMPPFSADTPYATFLKHLDEPPPLARAAALGCPPGVVGVIEAALAKDRRDRFPTVGAFVEALREAQASAPPVSPPATRHPRSMETVTSSSRLAGRRPAATSRPLGRRLPALLAALVAFALAALVAFALVVSLLSREPAGRPSLASPPPTPTAVPLEMPVPASPSPSTEPVSSPPPAVAATPVKGAPDVSSGKSERARRPEAASSDARKAQPAPVEMPSLEQAPSTARGASTPTPVDTGTLALTVVPQAEVILDGKSLGTLTKQDIRLAAGIHALRILHRDYEPLPRKFTIRSGETLALVLDLQEKAIPKRAR